MPTTASANHSTSQRVPRRARSWAPKKSMANPSAAEIDLHRGTRGSVLHLPLLGGAEAEGVGDDAVREGLALDVVGRDRVVEGLAGEADAVLGAGQFLLQQRHVLVGLQIRIGLGEREEAPQRAAEC